MKYRSFPDLPIEIETCYNLFTPRRLKKTDLRSLESDRLVDWMQDTVTYVGGEDDFRELLPRFFELAWEDANSAGGFDGSPLWPITALPSWPEHEREAVQACFMLLWRLVLEHENDCGVSEMLQTLKNAEISWLPYLDVWLNSSASTRALAYAFNTRFWENMPAEVPQWLLQQAVTDRIQADFFAAPDEDMRMVISEFEQEIAYYCSTGRKPE